MAEPSSNDDLEYCNPDVTGVHFTCARRLITEYCLLHETGLASHGIIFRRLDGRHRTPSAFAITAKLFNNQVIMPEDRKRDG